METDALGNSAFFGEMSIQFFGPIYGIQKDDNNNPVYETARDTDVQNSLLDSVGEGEGGMIWENGVETCISYVK